MKHIFLMFLACCIMACTKNHIGSPSRPSSTGNDVGYYNTTAKVLRVGYCDEEPVLMEFTEGGWTSMFTFPYGFNRQNEYWSFGVPDSLKAPGQELMILFAPILARNWRDCGRTTNPNQIELKSIRPDLSWSEIEVIDVTSGCGKAIVKIAPNFKYTYGNPVITLNLPDSLMVVGRRAVCYFRYASLTERIKCNSALDFKQVVITDLMAW